MDLRKLNLYKINFYPRGEVFILEIMYYTETADFCM